MRHSRERYWGAPADDASKGVSQRHPSLDRAILVLVELPPAQERGDGASRRPALATKPPETGRTRSPHHPPAAAPKWASPRRSGSAEVFLVRSRRGFVSDRSSVGGARSTRGLGRLMGDSIGSWISIIGFESRSISIFTVYLTSLRDRRRRRPITPTFEVAGWRPEARTPPPRIRARTGAGAVMIVSAARRSGARRRRAPCALAGSSCLPSLLHGDRAAKFEPSRPPRTVDTPSRPGLQALRGKPIGRPTCAIRGPMRKGSDEHDPFTRADGRSRRAPPPRSLRARG
jgi:hypothetical protein